MRENNAIKLLKNVCKYPKIAVCLLDNIQIGIRPIPIDFNLVWIFSERKSDVKKTFLQDYVAEIETAQTKCEETWSIHFKPNKLRHTKNLTFCTDLDTINFC